MNKNVNLDAIPAHLDNYIRIFGGFNKFWNGSVASIIPCKGKRVYGILTKISKNDVQILDSYEKGYKRHVMNIVNRDTNTVVKAVVYIKNDDITYNHPPSSEYMLAISKTLNSVKYIRKSNIPIYSYQRYSKRIILEDIWKNKN